MCSLGEVPYDLLLVTDCRSQAAARQHLLLRHLSPSYLPFILIPSLFARRVGGAVAGGKGGAEAEVGRAQRQENKGQQKPSKGPSPTVKLVALPPVHRPNLL